MKVLKIIGGLLLVALIIAQFFSPKPPANQDDNPGDIIENGLVEGQVAQLLKNSCYDCHSNQVSYPWYSYVAPVSFLVNRDVEEGKEELNFSEWQDYDKRRKLRKLKEVGEVLEEDEMPLGIYTLIHQGAKLSDEEKALLISWSEKLAMQTMRE